MGPDDIANTKKHNEDFPNYHRNVRVLNANVVNWLTSYIVVNEQVKLTNVAQKYVDSLNAPNYTVFSNTTSAAEWDEFMPEGSVPVVRWKAATTAFIWRLAASITRV